MDLNVLREEIDEIDSRLVDLFVKRMAIVEKVACYKIENDMPVFHPAREKEVIARARERAGEKMAGYAEDFFEAAMAISRRMQESMIAQRR